MLNRNQTVLLAILALVIGVTACLPTVTPTTNPITPTLTISPTTPTPTTAPVTPTVPMTSCTIGDQIPYVYHDYRLTKVTDCSHAIGVVDALRQEADGDIHLALQCANDACKALLTAGNTTNQHGDLVVEFVCVYPPTQADAVQPCSADPNPFKPAQAPQVGQCIWIDGRGVSDGIHGWGEIHPVGAFGQAAGQCSGMTAKIFTLDAEPDDGE